MVATPLSSGDDTTDDWQPRELWALEDNYARFALDAGKLVLWRRMGIGVAGWGARAGDPSERVHVCGSHRRWALGEDRRGRTGLADEVHE